MNTLVEVVARRGTGGRTELPVVRSRGQLAVRRTGPETVHLVATAFGPLGGDDAEIRLTVEAGATLRVRSVAAAVALPSRDAGVPSRQRIRADVAGVLHLRPEPTVVAAAAHHTAVVEALLTPDAELRLTEQVLLGRSGEDPGGWTGTMRIERCGTPLLHTTVHLGPGAAAWLPPVTPRAYASSVHLSSRPEPSAVAAAATTATTAATAGGAVRLPLPGGWVATAWGGHLHLVTAELDALIGTACGRPAA